MGWAQISALVETGVLSREQTKEIHRMGDGLNDAAGSQSSQSPLQTTTTEPQ